MIVDVHAHLDLLDDLDSVIERAKEAGVKAIVTNGTNPVTNRKSIDISDKYDIVKHALGIYPVDALKMTDDEVSEELDWMREQSPIAIGEIGIDYNEELSDREVDKMKSVFRQQILLAQDLDIPVIIHSRKAEDDVVEILEEVGYRKVVMHCFSGNKKLVKRIINNKWYFSIPTNVVRAEHFKMIVELCPLKQLFTETDSPFLSPDDDANEPAKITKSIPVIADIKGLTEEETKNQLYMNWQKLFL